LNTSAWTALEKLSASIAADWLTANRSAILVRIEAENPVAVDGLKVAIEKAEPSGLQMALVRGTFNKILDGLEDEEKTALPQGAVELLDWLTGVLTSIAKGA
jgi:hypothetical protein